MQSSIDALASVRRYRGAQRRRAVKLPFDPVLAIEAKAVTALAFRNGPIENLHAGSVCTACCGKPEFSHVSDDEMKEIMKAAVNAMYRLLWQRDHDPAAYLKSLALGERYTRKWDDPEIQPPRPGQALDSPG
jgi:hypothetical protein